MTEPTNSKAAFGNYTPTEATVRCKLAFRGKLFAEDEVRALIQVIDVLRRERNDAVAAMREIQRKYVRTDKA